LQNTVQEPTSNVNTAPSRPQFQQNPYSQSSNGVPGQQFGARPAHPGQPGQDMGARPGIGSQMSAFRPQTGNVNGVPTRPNYTVRPFIENSANAPNFRGPAPTRPSYVPNTMSQNVIFV
jgi:hypothetical protein